MNSFDILELDRVKVYLPYITDILGINKDEVQKSPLLKRKVSKAAKLLMSNLANRYLYAEYFDPAEIEIIINECGLEE